MREKNKLVEKQVVDLSGKTIYTGMCSSITGLPENHFMVRRADEQTQIFNSAGTQVSTFTPEDQLYISGDWVTDTTSEGRVSYPLMDFIAGDTSTTFDSKIEKIKATDEYIGFYVVSRDGLKGFSDGKGNLLYPCQLEEVKEFASYGDQGIFLAKENGKWGLMKKPKK